MKTFRLAIGVGAILAIMGLTGCSNAKDTPPTISQHQLEQDVARVLYLRGNKPLPSVKCPKSGMLAHVGETIVCATQLDSGPRNTTVTITAINGNRIAYRVDVSSSSNNY